MHTSSRHVYLWLWLCAALVVAMVLLGGYTRLSGSGLSITEWKPIHGAIPPLSDAEWAEEFAAYRQSPQYQKINADMTLGAFKGIFWPEFLHRLLGRAIGVVFLLPLLYFSMRGVLSRPQTLKLLGIFALGGLQGLIGWLMVKSGLVDAPRVSHIRLALHFMTAMLLLGLIVWEALRARAIGNRHKAIVDTTHAHCPMPNASFYLWFALLLLQLTLGALTAGLHAGLVYNTWPDMNGQFVPEGLAADPVALTQFLHRNVAVLVALGFIFWWYCHREYVKNARLIKLCSSVAALIFVQFALGVLTLISVVALPLALLHQAGGVTVFVAAVVLLKMVIGHGSLVMGKNDNQQVTNKPMTNDQ